MEAASRMLFRSHTVESYALSVTFVTDRRIAHLNRQALGRKGPTDVIAFDVSEAGLPYDVVGDIYISIDRARVNSRAFRVNESEEILRLVVHGVLHLVGYSDQGAQAKRRMERAQEIVVKRLTARLPRARAPR